MASGLSKSRIQKGLQCPKALWLQVHRPGVALPVSESQQWVFDQGTEVGILARELFPGGVEIAEDHRHSNQALAATAAALASGARVMYEAAFSYDGVLVRADIMVAADDGRWDLYEVKSATALKDVHISDAGVQAYVVEGAGIALRSVNIIHINSSYLYGGGEYDLEALFRVNDITPLARECLGTMGDTITRLREVLDGPEPEVRVGSQCSHPYPCEFREYCHSFLPSDYPITHLPRLSEQLLHELLEAGHTCILDVPHDFPGLTASQRRCVSVVQAGEPHVDVAALAKELSALRWPVYHLDFETVNPALPIWPGTRPYQVVPFQYSLHVHYPDGRTKHREYLHVGDGDPRRALARHLIADCGRRGSVVHYTPYERTQIEGLIAALPDMAPSLGFIRKRLFDLEPLIRLHTSHPAAAGRSSIKSVLPAWCPDLSYSTLNISDGQTASVRYLRAHQGMLAPAEAERVYADLAEYCGLDTFAMVRLLEEMQRRAAGESGEAV